MKIDLSKGFLTVVVFAVLFSCKEENKKFDKKVMPLWEITKEGKDTSYLLGTTEYLPKDTAKLMFTEKIIAAFDSAEVYITQIDIQHSDFIKVKPALEIDSGKMLLDILSERDFSTLEAMKKEWDVNNSNSIPAPDSMRLKLLFYLQDVLYHNNQNSFYFDKFWSERAMPMGKKMGGLETYQAYYKSFEVVALEEQIDFMNKIQNFETYTKSLRSEVMSLYLDKDYEGLHQLYLDKFPHLKEHYNSLISQKHTEWANKLTQALDTASCYVTLDVVHFHGKDNLKQELLSKGYKITRIQ